MNAGSLLAAAFLVLSPGTHHPAAAAAAASPSPAVSFATANPVLIQQSPLVWTTTVLLDESPSCLSGLSYQLVTRSPDYLVTGTVQGTVTVGPVAGGGCGRTAGADSEVTLAFRLPAQFPTVPLEAALVVDDPGGAAPPATVAITVQRLVTPWEYLWIPLICGGAMALLLPVLVGIVPFWRTLRRLRAGRPLDRSGNGFWRRPIYASGAWSFQDSWATNISAAGTIIAGTLTAAGAVSTLLPGVQLDRFAILIAICGGIIVAAPLAFGVLNAWSGRSRGIVPDNATLRFPGHAAQVDAPAGASLTFAGSASTADRGGKPVRLRAGGTVPVPAGCRISATLTADGVAVVPGDGTIVLKGARTLQIGVGGNEEFTVPADAVQRTPRPAGAGFWRRLRARIRPGVAAMIPAPAQAVHMSSGRTINMPVPTGDGVTVGAVGFVTARIPRGTIVTAPGARERTFRHETSLRVPLDDDMIAADMRSLIPAGMITLFGIGAELGLLAVLASALSAASSEVHVAAAIVAGVMAVVLILYSAVTTITLTSAPPGSALTATTKTSYTL